MFSEAHHSILSIFNVLVDIDLINLIRTTFPFAQGLNDIC